jgi:hypothetical protein
MDVHSELSCLIHAAMLAFEDCGGYPTIQYRNRTYLTLVVEVWSKKDAQKVIDRLHHGLLHGPYDYRFRGICHAPLESMEAIGPHYVSASVDLTNSKRAAA